MSVLYLIAVIATSLTLSINAEILGEGKGTVRLFRDGEPTMNQAWSSGIVQVYYNSDWGNICFDNGFGFLEANVICQQLSYTGASSFGTTNSKNTYGKDNSSTIMENVQCSSIYRTITQCEFSSSPISQNCANDVTDLVVQCHTTKIWDYPVAGDIRLMNGNYSNEGLLQVYCNGRWGTVCNDHFSGAAAYVACLQLGYNVYHDYNTLQLTGSSSDPIWLNRESTCYSNSEGEVTNCLTDCMACPYSEDYDCSHSQDVTLRCEYSSSLAKTTVTSSSLSCTSGDFAYDDEGLLLSIPIIIGISIGGLCLCIACIACISVPICICICIGVGVGTASKASSSKEGRRLEKNLDHLGQQVGQEMSHTASSFDHPQQSPFQAEELPEKQGLP